MCFDCPQTNCKTCDTNVCYQCVGLYSLYQGACVLNCPTATISIVDNTTRKCSSCIVGCINCNLGVNICTTCDSGYLKESNSTGTYCTAACSSGYLSFNNSICYTSCPDGYEALNQVCSLKQSAQAISSP
jgi:hypothetical protein